MSARYKEEEVGYCLVECEIVLCGRNSSVFRSNTLHKKIKEYKLSEPSVRMFPRTRSRYSTTSLNMHGELLEDRKWNGIIGMLADRQVNISCSDLTMTTPRVQVVDFIEPVWTSRYR
jgi:hypothetical protein